MVDNSNKTLPKSFLHTIQEGPTAPSVTLEGAELPSGQARTENAPESCPEKQVPSTFLRTVQLPEEIGPAMLRSGESTVAGQKVVLTIPFGDCQDPMADQIPRIRTG